jgi:rhodanese-related sulfurtransferase
MQSAGRERQALSPDKVRELLAAGHANAVDVRDEEGWKSGRLPGALHIPADEVASRLEELPEEGQIIVACEKGDRSAEVAEELRERGFDAVIVEGGMEAWNRARLPVQPSEDPDTPV